MQVYCQLDTLRRCLPSSIRRALDELPVSLDETYARALRGIPREKWQHAHRLFQCLVAAVRPLRVEELGEIFGIQFGSDPKTAFKVEESWRPENAEDAVLSACSTLIGIVSDEDSKIVQFSHFSVKEFLISDRLATMNDKNTSRYHIGLEPAHAVLAQACLAELLQLDDKVDKKRVMMFPLALYAAVHWVKHAQFGAVASQFRDGMERLFDPTKAHLAAWIWIFDIDHGSGSGPESLEVLSERQSLPRATPLYYAALCGFRGLVEHLIIAHVQNVNADSGYWNLPLIAAAFGRHLDVVRLLYEHGADVGARDDEGNVPLHISAWKEDLETMHFLLECGADANARDNVGATPLWDALYSRNIKTIRLLLEHGADVDVQSRRLGDVKPLHRASSDGQLEIVRLLLQHHANVNARDRWAQTPLHRASLPGHASVVQLLLEYGANVDAQDEYGRTPLCNASKEGELEVVRILLGHGADVHVRGKRKKTALQEASAQGYHEIVQLLLEHGAGEQEDSASSSGSLYSFLLSS
jgi:ankyrin repeat protein